MRNSIPILVAAALAAPAFAQEAAPEAAKEAPEKAKFFKVGAEVDPSITLKDIHGRTHKLKDYRGKVVFINFWSKDCPALRAANPKLNQIRADYPDKEVVVLGIDANVGEIGVEPPGEEVEKPYAAIVKHVADKELRFPILVDHGNVVADRFQARTTPHCFVIDQKGILRYSGALDDDPRGRKGDEASNYVRDAIDAVLAGKEVATTTTRPYG